MSLDGEICAYVRGCKNKKRAVVMASTLFGISEQKVISALQSYGLLDGNGKYIEPVRLTGKEVTMGKKGQRVNYPAFPWSQKRKKILTEEYQAGTPIPQIAKKLGTDEDTVYQGVAKFNLVKVTHKPASDEGVSVSAASPSEMSAMLPLAETQIQAHVSPTVDIVQSLPDMRTPLKEILHFVVDAANHNDDAIGALSEKCEGQVYFELGQQCVKLGEAAKIIKRLLDIFPEP